jgi:hypothetical protein
MMEMDTEGNQTVLDEAPALLERSFGVSLDLGTPERRPEGSVP